MFLFCFQYTLMTKHCRWKPVGKKTEFSMKSRSLSSCYYTRAHLYASSMRRAFSEGPCGVLDAFGINRSKPLRRLHRLPHDGASRQETEANPSTTTALPSIAILRIRSCRNPLNRRVFFAYLLQNGRKHDIT